MYNNIINNIVGKFHLTKKFFKDTKGNLYKYMSQEWQDLIKSDYLFTQCKDCKYIYWCYYIKLNPKGRYYRILIEFNIKTGLLENIMVQIPKPVNKEDEKRYNEIIKRAKKIFGYFVAVMIHHGYIEKI